MTRLKTMPLKVPNRILYEDKESHELYEMVSVDECAELMGVTVTKIEGLMFGFKLIKIVGGAALIIGLAILVAFWVWVIRWLYQVW